GVISGYTNETRRLDEEDSGIHGLEQYDDFAELHRLLVHDGEIEEAVLQGREGGRKGDTDEDEAEEGGEHEVAKVDAGEDGGDPDEGNGRRCSRHVCQPPELLTLLATGSAEPQDESDHGGDAGDDHAEGAGRQHA